MDLNLFKVLYLCRRLDEGDLECDVRIYIRRYGVHEVLSLLRYVLVGDSYHHVAHNHINAEVGIVFKPCAFSLLQSFGKR